MSPIKDISSLSPATKQAFSLFEEFKNFAFKGSVIDLAVGVMIGAAFGKIIDSFVKNILMPLVSRLTPTKLAYENWELALGPDKTKTIKYGLFLSDIVNFMLISAILFIFIVKFLGWVMRTKKNESIEPPPLTKEQELLTEIRDLLKQSQAT